VLQLSHVECLLFPGRPQAVEWAVDQHRSPRGVGNGICLRGELAARGNDPKGGRGVGPGKAEVKMREYQSITVNLCLLDK